MNLHIRKMNDQDLEPLYRLLSDPEVTRFLEPPYTREQISAFHQAWMSENPPVFTAEADGAFIGYVIFHPYEEDSSEIGWVLLPEYWNKGCASELTRQMIEKAEGEGKTPVIECDPRQEVTKHIARKFGFVQAGTRDGLEVYRRDTAAGGFRSRTMELRKINLQDAAAQWEYTTALPADENGLTNPYHGVSFEEYQEKVLPALISYEHPVNMPDWFVPETYYYLWDECRLVGEFRIRHHLTEALRNGAGHIGYSVRKEERGKGYGTAGLKLTLQAAGEVVPEDEIYLRVNRDNPASLKVMLRNGGRIAAEDESHFFVRIANPGKGRYPSAKEAQEILAEAERCNPGPWGSHSRTAAHCAEKIALYSGLCPEKAYVLGLLHDIGRKFGKRHLGHVPDGYSYMMKLDYPDAARICLTHSFNEMRIEGYIGNFDTTEAETELIRTKLRETVPDDYDLLIQLCDAISGSEGVMDITERMSDVKRRYGAYDQGKWNRNLELKSYFENRMHRDLYDAVEKDSFHN